MDGLVAEVLISSEHFIISDELALSGFGAVVFFSAGHKIQLKSTTAKMPAKIHSNLLYPSIEIIPFSFGPTSGIA